MKKSYSCSYSLAYFPLQRRINNIKPRIFVKILELSTGEYYNLMVIDK